VRETERSGDQEVRLEGSCLLDSTTNLVNNLQVPESQVLSLPALERRENEAHPPVTEKAIR
jgi:hypothetical protein